MLHLALVYLHLLATCLAIGLLLACDLRLLARLADRGSRGGDALRPPSRFEVQAVTGALVVLLVTGVALVGLAVQARPDALANPKLQAKGVLVALLLVNAVVLHRWTFPRLARGVDGLVGAATGWRRGPRLAGVALPVAVSHALWGLCAFLGIARPWNFTRPIDDVLGVAAAVVGVTWIVVTAAMVAATARPARPVGPRPGRRAPTAARPPIPVAAVAPDA